MSIMSLAFLAFLLITILIYYRVKEKYRWKVLLCAGILFAGSYSWKNLIWVILSSLSIWMAGRWLCAASKLAKCKKKAILSLTVGFNLGILLVLKYLGFFLDVYFDIQNPFTLWIPIGLSYYTLEAIGYLVDVYWGRTEAERSYGKLLLFLTYFPKLLQGPITRYRDISLELCGKDHSFCSCNIKFGVQRMIWGYFKLSVIYNVTQEYVSRIFFGYITPYGFTVFLGLILFGFELYANFSGGIDVTCGISQCLGITLPENFQQPFFSKSLGEFWRRWHMTLGSWMKDYVFFPVSMSKTASRLKKQLKKKLPKKLVNRLVIAAADVLVFLIVGMWHGTGTNYVLWGLYNGVILAVSELMTDVYARSRTALHISGESRLWKGFCILRTCLIVTIGWVTDCSFSGGAAVKLVKDMCALGMTNLQQVHFETLHLMVMIVSVVLLLAVDILHERKISIRETLEKQDFWIQVLFWTVLLQVMFLFDKPLGMGGLMYAVF